jgi:hypothetical protein
MRSPVLFLVFNRPDTTAQVFERIRAAKPPRLYVSADGPRADRKGELEACLAVRAIATQVDWPCELKTLFQDHNLGCKMGVSTGISWFFDQEPEGIILEDDVVPVPSFFDYCDELLEKYRLDKRVGMISGSNLVSSRVKCGDSYFFSKIPLIWGWAAWRRSWQQYDVSITEWPSWDRNGGLEKLFPGKPLVTSYWRDAFERVFHGKLNTWDYQLMFARWRHGGLTIIPTNNLTDNLGYGLNATHTSQNKPACLLESPAIDLTLPLKHPVEIQANDVRDLLIFKHVHEVNLMGLIRRQLRPLKKCLTAFKGTRS